MSQNYISKSTKDCIKYIETFGIDSNEIDSVSTIPSEAGLVYKLPNKEVVLIPSDFNPDYPGFIFRSADDLEKMIKSGFFPIESKYLTFWEIENNNLKSLPGSIKYFKNSLNDILSIKPTIYEISELKKIYQSLIEFKASKADLLLKEKLIVSYCILVMDYLVKKNKYTWYFEERFETYNPYTYPQVKLGSDVKNIIELMYICLDGEAASFEMFCNFTGLK
jgi:hypothetical protein